jgi:hypothetical protein
MTTMATRRPLWIVRLIHWKRERARRRLLMALGWKRAWDRTVSARQYLDGLRRQLKSESHETYNFSNCVQDVPRLGPFTYLRDQGRDWLLMASLEACPMTTGSVEPMSDRVDECLEFLNRFNDEHGKVNCTRMRKEFERLTNALTARDELLRDIAEYTGEGPHTTPWRAIVKDISDRARAILAEGEAK